MFALIPSLAQQSFNQSLRFHQLKGIWHFDTSLMMSLTWIAVAGGGMGVLFGGIWLWRWYHQPHRDCAPIRTFNRLARGLGLSLSDRWLMARIAYQQQLPTPLTLVLSGKTLSHYAHLYARSLSTHRHAKVMARVGAIHRTLFAEPSQPVETPILR